MFAQGSQPVDGVDRANDDGVIFRTRGKDFVGEPVDVVCLVRRMVIPTVLELDRNNANVPYTGLAVNVGRGKVVAIGIPSDASDFSTVAVASTLQLTVADKRSCDVLLVDCHVKDLAAFRSRIVQMRPKLTRHKGVSIIVPSEVDDRIFRL